MFGSQFQVSGMIMDDKQMPNYHRCSSDMTKLSVDRLNCIKMLRSLYLYFVFIPVKLVAGSLMLIITKATKHRLF